MVEELGDMLLDFVRASTHMRCFLHTTNLMAKALIKEFDVKPKRRSEIKEGVETTDDNKELSANEAKLAMELEELSEGIEHEDFVTLIEQDLTDEEKNNNDDGLVNDDDGLVNDIELLSDRERQDLLKSIEPIRLALVKVS